MSVIIDYAFCYLMGFFISIDGNRLQRIVSLINDNMHKHNDNFLCFKLVFIFIVLWHSTIWKYQES